MRIGEIISHTSDLGREKERIKSICKNELGIEQSVHVDNDLTVSIWGDRHEIIENLNIEILPVNFKQCWGGLTIRDNPLLTNLQGYPKRLMNSGLISSCDQLKTLKGAEDTRIDSSFEVRNLKSLESLEYAPIASYFIIDNCPLLTDFRGIEKHLKFISGGVGTLHFNFKNVKRGGIGLILVEDLESIFDFDKLPEPFKIIEKYLEKPNDIYECQAELIDAGFEEFAEI